MMCQSIFFLIPTMVSSSHFVSFTRWFFFFGDLGLMFFDKADVFLKINGGNGQKRYVKNLKSFQDYF